MIPLLRQKNSTDLDTKDGISLLSLKHHLLLSYLQSLALVSAHRALGHTLDDRSPPTRLFSTVERDARGSGAGDLVDSMVEGRVVLEKIKVLEGRMRYQIEKLVRVAEELPTSGQNGIHGKILLFLFSSMYLLSSLLLRPVGFPTQPPEPCEQ